MPQPSRLPKYWMPEEVNAELSELLLSFQANYGQIPSIFTYQRRQSFLLNAKTLQSSCKKPKFSNA
jgi:hypothetical protein